MFYKPTFCCNCGEKIDRIDWNLLTSRRFCQLCETEQKPHDLLPRVVVGIGVTVGLFGFGSYLQSGNIGKSDLQNLSRPVAGQKRSPAPEIDRKAMSANSMTDTNSESSGSGENRESNKLIAERSSVNAQSSQQTGIKNTTSDEPVYFCGAMTKKGTPCSRRVKSRGGRCWQHSGRTAAAETQKTSSGL